MTIGFDALIYGWPPGGIATYQTQLMAALKDEGDLWVAFSGGYGEGPPGVTRRFIGRKRIAFAANMARAAFWKSAIHHSTAFWAPPMLNAKARVLTIHDMIPERWGARFPAIAGAHYAKSKLASRADAVVVPTVATRNDVLELLKLPPEHPAAADANRHMLAALLAWGLYAASLFLRTEGVVPTKPGVLAVTISLAGFLALAATGWLGGKLVYVHGVGRADAQP